MKETGEPLAGVRVLEVGNDVSTRFAGWWLAELGAAVDVVQGDYAGSPAGGEDDEALFSRQVDRGKRHITLATLSEPFTGMPEMQAAAQYDVILADTTSVAILPAGHYRDGARSVLVASPCTSGSTFEASLFDDMTVWARSGLAFISRIVAPADQAGAIAFPRNRQPSLLAGTAMALAASSIALTAREPAATSAPGSITIDKLELLAQFPMQPIAFAQLEQRIVGRAEGEEFPGGIVAAADGLVYMRPVEPAQWRRLFNLVGGLEWASLELLQQRRFLIEAEPLIDNALTPWAKALPVEEIVAMGQRERVPLAPINIVAQVIADVHLNERGLFDRQPDLSRVTVPWLAQLGEAGEADEERGTRQPLHAQALPLSGLRILDLTWAWAGPYATTLLSDLGAEVINIEWDPRASNMRTQPPFVNGHEDSPNSSGWWSANQRGKLSVGVNLKDAEGTEIIHRLAAVSDAVIENFAPGVVDRLGVGYADLLRDNQQLVYVSMPAYGKSGPKSHYVGYGTQLLAASGAMHLLGPADDIASHMLIPYPDPVSGLVGALSLVTYVAAARRRKSSAFIDVSELESTCCMLLEPLLCALNRERAGPAEVVPDRSPLYLILAAADGAMFVACNAGFDDLTRLAGHLGAESTDRAVLQQTSLRLTGEQLATALRMSGVTWSVINDSAGCLNDERLIASGFWMDDTSPEIASNDIKIAASFWQINAQRTPIRRGAPLLFQDTRDVLKRTLNYTDEKIEQLFERGTVK